MKLQDFKGSCVRIFDENELVVPNNEQLEKLFALTERMIEVNKSMNLTAITEPNAIILKHYADSVTICPYINKNARIIDIGCGAGFPSLPLAIMRPDVDILALDSTAKRIEYVRQTARLLELDNLNAVAARAEELANRPEYRESFDHATARAVAYLPVLSELCLPFVKKNGSFIAMKAAQGEDELALAKNAIKLCGGIVESNNTIELFENGCSQGKRKIIVVKKESGTPTKYPRHFSQISKKPL